MSDITNAVIAAMNVDQQAVQGQTKGTSAAQFAAPDKGADDMEYEAYKLEQQAKGLRPIPIEQWRVMFRNSRQLTPEA